MTTAVALFTRAWIEIHLMSWYTFVDIVALFTRAWIEIQWVYGKRAEKESRPLHEGVD